jgi:hypothetical protein
MATALQDLFDDAIKAGKGIVENRRAVIQKMRPIGTAISLYATQTIASCELSSKRLMVRAENVHAKNWRRQL